MGSNHLSKSELDVSRFGLIPTSAVDILRYETLSEKQVRHLVADIRRRGILVNPIIWDSTHRLLIDGHHRLRALGDLGIGHIPAYHVDYLGCEVSVRRWYRMANVPGPRELASVLDSVGALVSADSGQSGWNLVVRCQRGSRTRLLLRDEHAAARALHLVCERMRGKGWSVSLTGRISPSQLRVGNVCVLYVRPVIGKGEIVGSAVSGRPFPPQVNRHLIDRRPVGLNAPVEVLMQPGPEAHRELLALLKESTPLLIHGASWHEGRFYEERVVRLF